MHDTHNSKEFYDRRSGSFYLAFDSNAEYRCSSIIKPGSKRSNAKIININRYLVSRITPHPSLVSMCVEYRSESEAFHRYHMYNHHEWKLLTWDVKFHTRKGTFFMRFRPLICADFHRGFYYVSLPTFHNFDFQLFNSISVDIYLFFVFFSQFLRKFNVYFS